MNFKPKKGILGEAAVYYEDTLENFLKPRPLKRAGHSRLDQKAWDSLKEITGRVINPKSEDTKNG